MLGFDSSGFCGRTTRPKPKPDRPRLRHIGVHGRHLVEAALPGDPIEIELFGDQVIVEAGHAALWRGFFHRRTESRNQKFSEHTITFIDVDNSTTLNCGDTIVLVS